MTYEIIELADLRDSEDQGIIRAEQGQGCGGPAWIDAETIAEMGDLLVCLTDRDTDPDACQLADDAADALGLPRPQRYAIDETDTLLTVYAW
jgi:hypothetical protein